MNTQPPAPAAHCAATAHIPAAHAASWSCTCGEAEVWDYAHAADAEWTMRLVTIRATNHRATAGLREVRP